MVVAFDLASSSFWTATLLTEVSSEWVWDLT